MEEIGLRWCIQNFRTGRLDRELQMVQLSATRCSCIATSIRYSNLIMDFVPKITHIINSMEHSPF
jgi:hypothetical protein